VYMLNKMYQFNPLNQ